MDADLGGALIMQPEEPKNSSGRRKEDARAHFQSWMKINK
jgi:hypothetical protein